MKNIKDSIIKFRIEANHKEGLARLADNLGLSLSTFITKRLLCDPTLINDFIQVVQKYVDTVALGTFFTLEDIFEDGIMYIDSNLRKSIDVKVIDSVNSDMLKIVMIDNTNGYYVYMKGEQSTIYMDKMSQLLQSVYKNEEELNKIVCEYIIKTEKCPLSTEFSCSECMMRVFDALGY